MSIVDACSGAFGALCLVATGNPFDRAKVKIQSNPSLYRGIRHCLKTMVRREGFLSLWKGSGAAFSSAVIENTVIFTSNGLLRRLVAKQNEAELTLLDHALIGAVSGIFSSTAICPAEVIKCRLQFQGQGMALAGAAAVAGASGAAAAPQERMYKGILDCGTQLVRQEGVRGLFRGITALWGRDIPFNFLFFGSYRTYIALLDKVAGKEKKGASSGASSSSSAAAGAAAYSDLDSEVTVRLDQALHYATGGGDIREEDKKKELEELPGGWVSLVAGGLAGGTAWTVILPFDVIKTRLSVAGMAGVGSGSSSGASRGLISEARAVFAEQGVKGFYRGWSSAVARAIPANAALFFGASAVEKALKGAGFQ